MWTVRGSASRHPGVILAQAAVDPAQELAGVARALLAAYARAAAGEILAGLDEAVAIRSADPALTPADVDRLPEVAALVRFLS
ncbi:hypothetical protein [Actinoplanes sp. DH11]|uniref:hypothetical protein n=1 Tax=Actinoplanes sp. DH11 TaxID=2857011 RepID=UPI001E2C6529|nr:hypothetical protein [Actinoplanes sp. DH11]